MARRTLHPLLQRLAALVIFGVGLGAGIATIAMPLAEAVTARQAAKQRLAKFDGLLKAPPAGGVLYDPDDLSKVHVDEAEAQIALQSTIDRVARGAGVAIQSVRPLPPDVMGQIGRSVWVEMSLTCDLQALVDLLKDLDIERPVLLIRRLEIERGDGPRPDNFLRVKFEAGRVWRAGNGAL